jgi:hypothetical protein
LEHPTVPVMSFPWNYWILPTLAVAMWVAAWWSSHPHTSKDHQHS